MSTTKTPIEQAQERYPDALPYGNKVRAYAACLEERAIPAEQALRVAMDFIRVATGWRSTRQWTELYEALRANPITAKMLEE